MKKLLETLNTTIAQLRSLLREPNVAMTVISVTPWVAITFIVLWLQQ